MSRLGGRGATVLGLVVGVAAAACGVHPSAAPVPVEGPRADLTALAGEWSGTYWSKATGRHGTLSFRLRPGADTAYGQVEMSFAPALEVYDEGAGDELRRRPCLVLDIAVVRAEGHTIRGTLAPYWDPDCDCRTHTVFEGELIGDRISGTFTSRRESRAAPLLTGRWRADRQ